MDMCVVFEDDVQFYAGFQENFKNVITNAPKNFDVILLDTLWCQNTIDYNKLFYKLKGQFFGMHGYIISKQGALNLLKNALPMEIQIDSYMAYYAELYNLNLYLCKDRLCTQIFHPSTIQQSCMMCTLTDQRIFIILACICLLCGIIFYTTITK